MKSLYLDLTTLVNPELIDICAAQRTTLILCATYGSCMFKLGSKPIDRHIFTYHIRFAREWMFRFQKYIPLTLTHVTSG